MSNSGTSSTNYRFSYLHPWLDSKQTSLGFSIYDTTNQFNDYGYNGNDSALRSAYERNRRGFDITLARPEGEYIQNSITIKQQQASQVKYISGPVDYTNPNDPLYKNYYQNNFGVTRSILLNRTFDNRDSIFDPSEGSLFSLGAEFAGRGLGGDFNFEKYTLETRNYKKFGGNQVLAFRLKSGYAAGNIPENSLFDVGGSDSLRGYKEAQFKGNKLILSSLEYRFPIVKRIQGVFFFDAGNAWNGAGYNISGIKTSFGSGLRIASPIGPLRFDYAKGSEGWKTSFTFGGQF